MSLQQPAWQLPSNEQRVYSLPIKSRSGCRMLTQQAPQITENGCMHGAAASTNG